MIIWKTIIKNKPKRIESKSPSTEWDEFLSPLIQTIRELQRQLNIQEGDLNLKMNVKD